MQYEHNLGTAVGLTLDELTPPRVDSGADASAPTLADAADAASSLEDVIAAERSILAARRKQPLADDVIGLALSGGGIRSATLSLGFLQVLTKQRVLAMVDYLSTVSGAGYASSYLYASAADPAIRSSDLTHVFDDEERHAQLIRAGKYLAPGRGVQSAYNMLRVLGTVAYSTLLNLAWLAALVSAISYGIRALAAAVSSRVPAASGQLPLQWDDLLPGSALLAGWVLALHLVGVALSDLRPELRGPLRRAIMSAIGVVVACMLTILLAVQSASMVDSGVAALEDGLKAWGGMLQNSQRSMAWVLFTLLSLLWILPKAWSAVSDPEERWVLLHQWLPGVLFAALCVSCAYSVAGGTISSVHLNPGAGSDWECFVTSSIIFVMLGFMANANALSSHALFSDLIARAFLTIGSKARRSFWSRPLETVFLPRRAGLRLKDLATDDLPYPLFNTCANLFDENDESFPGARGNDYFVLSPRFCGCRWMGYAKTTQGAYADLSLAEAVACSAASVSPLMGSDGNKALSVLLGVFNLTLNRWLPNPRQRRHRRFYFWPYYQVRALLGKLGTSLDLVNVTDGGFIENLGAFELLRRRCKLIICLDNTYDPAYEFKHLRNLVMRARNELGLEIEFEESLEELVRPSAAHGFSKKSFVVGKVRALPGSKDWDGGCFIYAKASVTKPRRWQDLDTMEPSYRYKAYHPQFPQERTSDQFFDEVQWKAHFRLGQEIAARVLGYENLEDSVLHPKQLTREQVMMLCHEPVRATD